MASAHSPPPGAQETTPLLRDKSSKQGRYGRFTTHLLFLTAFLVSLSFGVTQVPLLYVFRLMTCDGYYKDHPDQEPKPGTPGDRCDLPAIEASTARAVALVSGTTTFFGIINLFITGWTVKKIGVKRALAIQVFWPAVRLLVQNVGVYVGGYAGINIIQSSQIITVVGGPNGYLLSLNSFVTEVVVQKERTGSLGRLQGCMFFGMATGFLAGGIIAEQFGIAMPFKVTLALFCISTIYVLLFLPSTPPPPDKQDSKDERKGFTRLIGPFKMFMPVKWRSPKGVVRREYGPLLLGYGAFMGVLATGVVPVVLQLYATDVFHWETKKNSILVSSHSFLRGIFLTTIFPRIISLGRAWLKRRNSSRGSEGSIEREPEVLEQLESATVGHGETAIAGSIDGEGEPLLKTQSASSSVDQEQYHFDLWFTKFSLVADGLLSALAVFVFQDWQLYLIALIIPFASGTGAAAKGTMIQMCTASERVDALSAITLIENIARLSTSLIFGVIFAALTEAGRPELVFVCIGGVSILGFLGLLFCHFPEEGSSRLHSLIVEQNNAEQPED